MANSQTLAMLRHVRAVSRRRDALIRQARREGYSLRQIAKAAGMTAPGVQYVLDHKGNDNGQ